MSTEVMAPKRNKRSEASKAIAKAIIDQYQPSNAEEMQDALRDIFGPMPLFYEMKCFGNSILFTHFLFSDANAAYPYFQLSSLKDGTFDKACESEDVKRYELVVKGHCHQNFEKRKVVSVSASGLDDPSYLLIEASEDELRYEHMNIVDR